VIPAIEYDGELYVPLSQVRTARAADPRRYGGGAGSQADASSAANSHNTGIAGGPFGGGPFGGYGEKEVSVREHSAIQILTLARKLEPLEAVLANRILPPTHNHRRSTETDSLDLLHQPVPPATVPPEEVMGRMVI
jgi:hypothetical protein